MLFFANILGFISANRRLFVAVLIAILLLVVAFWWKFCRQSELEQRIAERSPVIVEQQQAVNSAVNAAINANLQAETASNLANKALEAANTVRRDHQTNVSIDNANKNRCIAFPESAECR